MKINKLKWFFAAICLSLLQLQSFAGDPVCTVSGKISGLEKDGKILVSSNGGDHGGSKTVKTAIIKANGDFSFTIPAALCNEMYDFKIEGVRSAVSFIAEKGHVEITGDKSKLYTALIKGTPENDRWASFQKFSYGQTMKSNEMNMSGNKFSKEEKVAFFKKLEAEKKSYVDSLISKHPNSIVSLSLAKGPLMMMKHYQIDAVLIKFKPYFSTHPYYIAMKKRADILRKVAPGAIAPDFNVLQPDGKSKISLSSFRGKYVMLDFWASWCVPCRAENPHTKAIYEKYNAQGLEVISFSLDHEIEAWKNAIVKDGITWRNASDLVGGLKSPVAQTYGIDGIPAIWIIDPNGKIIAEGVRGEDLDKLLESLFNKKG